MPQTDQDKDTVVLLNEIKTYLLDKAATDKIDELLDREIKNNDPDELEVGGLPTTKGGIRPKHAPLVP